MKFNLGRKKPENKDVDALAAVPEQTPPFPPTQQRHHSTSDEDELSSVGEDSNSSTGARDDYKNNNKSDTSSTKLFQTKKKGSTTPALEAAYKFGIADRLTRTVEVKVAQSTVKRSPDLVPLTRQFDAFRKKIHKIIELTKKYHSSLTQVDENRLRVREKTDLFFLLPLSKSRSHE
jgi:DNA repair ATPase RecN